MIALVKDVNTIGLLMIFQTHVLNVNQNIGTNQKRKLKKK